MIANNQVGFTTDPHDSRSTRYSSDLAKGFDIPIIHVNADAVDACRSAVRLAMAFRERFGRDVLIDLVGYRRFGHNETDEPSYTQPLQVERIKAHPSVVTLYARRLIDDGLTDEAAVDARRSQMHGAAGRRAPPLRARRPHRARARRAHGARPRPGRRARAHGEELIALSDALLELPEGFTVHPKLGPQLERRRAAIREGGIDWGHAEALAFGSLLADGIAIRMTGQDTERGTFSHRHLVLHDVHTGERYAPMQHLADSKARFEVHNSPLSEAACLGFEYGYSVTRRNALVIWEAQFGDFANGAQVLIDQFIASGRSKWGVTSRLTLFLPHGYEGNGPEHSSARLERFLQLAADDNLRIANVTTPGAALPPAAPPGRGPYAPAARRHDAEGPAAAQGVAVVAVRLHRSHASSRSSTTPTAPSGARTSAGSCSAPAASTTTSSATPSAPAPTRSRSRASSSSTRSRRPS